MKLTTRNRNGLEEVRADEKAKTLQEVYEKAYKLDWSEDAFVIWLEAEIKKGEKK